MLTLYLSPANQRAMTRAEAEHLRTRYGAGYGGLLAVGDPETVAGELKKLADAGFDGFCFSVVAYNDETLEIKYRGKSIADVLELTVDQAVPLMENLPAIANKLRTLQSVGLGYVALGQSATTLSGGEAQRVKLAKELSKRGTGRTLYILDEPTTGLHFEDTRKLLDVLTKLVDQGNTIVVIEHNLDVIKTADWVIDMGPEGGAGGGTVVAAGTPEDIASNAGSYTGRYLKPLLR